MTARAYLIVLPMAFLAALVDAIAGGGGLISLPAYTLAGLDYDFASGSNKLSACCGTLVSAVRYWRGGRVLAGPALVAAALALPGAWLGTRAAMALGSRAMHAFMVFATPVVGALVVFRGAGPDRARHIARRAWPACAAIGLGMGFYDGFFGPGMGTLLILLFTWLVGMDAVSASGSAKVVNLASNLASLATRVAAGNVVYALAVPAMACAMAGGWLGARLAITRGARLIRWVMLGVLALLTARLAAELLGWAR